MPKWRQVRATLPLSRSKSIQANRIRASRLSSAPVRANRSEPGGFPLRTCISTLYASVTNHSEREHLGQDVAADQSDDYCLFVLAKHFAHGVGNFPDGRVSFHGSQNVRHEIRSRASGGLDLRERGLPRGRIPPRAEST